MRIVLFLCASFMLIKTGNRDVTGVETSILNAPLDIIIIITVIIIILEFLYRHKVVTSEAVAVQNAK